MPNKQDGVKIEKPGGYQRDNAATFGAGTLDQDNTLSVDDPVLHAIDTLEAVAIATARYRSRSRREAAHDAVGRQHQRRA